jgi:hypothetical protein
MSKRIPQSKLDTGIRVTQETSRELSEVATEMGFLKKEFLMKLAKKLLQDKKFFDLVELKLKEK